ncbi:MAG: hypothetical protein Q9222_007761 [Ikaeria aurantiellina]
MITNWDIPKEQRTDLRRDRDHCETQILTVNRQLYDEGTDYLYCHKHYVLNIWPQDFPYHSDIGPIEDLPSYPYHKIENLLITFPSIITWAGGQELRQSFLWICGLLALHKAHFKKLRIAVRICCADSARCWSAAVAPDWDDPFPTSHHSVSLRGWFLLNELGAFEESFTAIFAQLLSPLAMLDNVADECVIVLPDPIKDQEYMINKAQWYEEGLTGKYAFTEENAPKLREDREAFQIRYQHRNGPIEGCKCKGCKWNFPPEDDDEWADWCCEMGREVATGEVSIA